MCSKDVQSGPHVPLPSSIGKLLVGLSDLVSLWNSVLVGKKVGENRTILKVLCQVNLSVNNVLEFSS